MRILLVFSADTSVLNFLAWHGYSLDEAVQYNAAVDYQHLRETREEQLRNDLIREAEGAITKDELMRMDAVARIIKSWYLFETPDSTGMPTVYSLIGRLIEDRPPREVSLPMNVGIIWSPFSSSISATAQIPINGLSKTLSIDHQYVGGSTGISLGYRFIFDPALGMFSHLDVKLLAFLTYTHQSLNSQEGYTQLTINGSTYREDVLTRLGGSSTISSHTRIVTGLSTPLLKIFGKQYIEIGCYAGFARTLLKVDYHYRYLVKTGDVVGGKTQMTNYVMYYSSSPDGGATSVTWQPIITPWLGFVVQLTPRFSVEPEVSLIGGYLSANYHF